MKGSIASEIRSRRIAWPMAEPGSTCTSIATGVPSPQRIEPLIPCASLRDALRGITWIIVSPIETMSRSILRWLPSVSRVSMRRDRASRNSPSSGGVGVHGSGEQGVAPEATRDSVRSKPG